MDNKFIKVAEHEGKCVYHGILLATGTYPAQSIELSEDDLLEIAWNFESLPLQLEFVNTVFDKKLGNLTAIMHGSSILSAVVEIPSWVAKLLGDEIFIGAAIDRNTKLLAGASITSRSFTFVENNV